MKKHTIKRIALGLALAGYAASSAWALTGTTAPIQGQRPVLKSQDASKAKAITVTTEKKSGGAHADTEHLSVGDKVILTYVLDDADGDVEGKANNANSSIQMYHRKELTDAWTPFPASAVVRAPSDKAGTKSSVTFTVPEEALGSKYIGFKVLEKTEFGYPAGDRWYKVPDALNKLIDLGNGTDDDLSEGGNNSDNIGKPGDTDVGGPGDVDTDVIPPNKCEVGEPCGVQPDNGTKVKIFEIVGGQPVETKDYASDKSIFPIVGGTYQARVYDEKNVDTTANYKTYQWKLTGNNAEAVKPAAGQDANNHAIAGATAQQYTVGTNSAFATFTAGAQGFNLQVEVNP